MLFLVGYEEFNMCFFMRKNETLLLKKGILNSGKMSSKSQIGLENEISIEYREDGGHVSMKSCLLNDKPRRKHCKVVDGDKLCFNKLAYFRIKIYNPEYFGESIYDQWNWVSTSIEESKYITKHKYDLMLLLGIKVSKPVLDIVKLRNIIQDMSKEAFNLKDFTSGRESNILEELIEKAVIYPDIDIHKANLAEFVFLAVSLSDMDLRILSTLAKQFDVKLHESEDSIYDFKSFECRYPNKTILPISNDICTSAVITFDELYLRIINGGFESAIDPTPRTELVSEPTYQAGTDFLSFFMQQSSNKTKACDQTSEIQTQSYNQIHEFEPSLPILDLPEIDNVKNTLQYSQVHPQINRSFMDTQKAFNESLKLHKPGETSSLTQTFGISQEEIQKRLQRKRQMEREKVLVEKEDMAMEPQTLKKQKIEVSSQILDKSENVTLGSDKGSRETKITPVTVSMKKETKALGSTSNIKMINMSDFHLVAKMHKHRKMIKVDGYSKETLHPYHNKFA
eukprot:NODE_36_length_31474_cov_0.342438.p5 type:complete len:510 gc:universal NODE_36_length_31474_cov_0.342438:12285-10756(-)